MNSLDKILKNEAPENQKIEQLIELLQNETAIHNANEEGMPYDKIPRVSLQNILKALSNFGVEFNDKSGLVSRQGVVLKARESFLYSMV